jgi:hypothetical protein
MFIKYNNSKKQDMMFYIRRHITILENRLSSIKFHILKLGFLLLK